MISFQSRNPTTLVSTNIAMKRNEQNLSGIYGKKILERKWIQMTESCLKYMDFNSPLITSTVKRDVF